MRLEVGQVTRERIWRTWVERGDEGLWERGASGAELPKDGWWQGALGGDIPNLRPSSPSTVQTHISSRLSAA